MAWPFSWIARRRHRRIVAKQVTRILQASYDAAKTTDENRRHWANADYLSAAAAAGHDVRRILRSRARYEVANNSIARGIVLTLANDVIGTGPRLQLQTENRELNRVVEEYFTAWMAATNLAAKLRTMRMARAQDGEAFAVMFTNRNLADPVKLDVRLVEADRVTTPSYGMPVSADERKAVDGIVLDEFGNPREYHILRTHPGALGLMGAIQEYDRVPAANVIHWFRADRPGQRRGLPDLLPALPLFAQLRRFTLATLTSAETAADLAVVMKTTSPPGGDAAEVDPWVTMTLERNMAMFAPEGWEPTQMKAEHPNARFSEFRDAIINEAGRCVNMPFNIAACNSSRYNYASGRLDHQTYDGSNSVERSELTIVGLDPIFAAWRREALTSPEYGLFGQIERPTWPHEWFWSGRQEIDPRWVKARDERLKTGLTTEAAHYGGRGLDWERAMEQRGRERKRREELGLPQPEQKQGARR